MDLVTPGLGLVFWMTLSFSIVLFILKKFAWKPILNSLKDRDDSIAAALNAAEKARNEIDELKANNDKVMREARIERDKLLKEARDIKEEIISEAKEEAKKEADKILLDAKKSIKNEKMAAITELKNQVANLSINIAEKILKQELKDKESQQKLTDNILKETSFN